MPTIKLLIGSKLIDWDQIDLCDLDYTNTAGDEVVRLQMRNRRDEMVGGKHIKYGVFELDVELSAQFRATVEAFEAELGIISLPLEGQIENTSETATRITDASGTPLLTNLRPLREGRNCK